MKKRVLYAVVLACFGLVCPVDSAAERVDPISVENSDCLGNPYYAPSVDDAENEDPYNPTVSWGIQYKDGILTMTWYQFEANCCPEGFDMWFDRDGDTLVFNAEEKGIGWCDCICTFNLTSTYGEIAPGKYVISFRNYGEEIFSAEVTIEEGCDISLPKAPSGIRTVSDDAGLLSLSAEGLLRVNSSEKAMVEIYDAGGSVRLKAYRSSRF